MSRFILLPFWLAILLACNHANRLSQRDFEGLRFYEEAVADCSAGETTYVRIPTESPAWDLMDRYATNQHFESHILGGWPEPFYGNCDDLIADYDFLRKSIYGAE